MHQYGRTSRNTKVSVAVFLALVLATVAIYKRIEIQRFISIGNVSAIKEMER